MSMNLRTPFYSGTPLDTGFTGDLALPAPFGQATFNAVKLRRNGLLAALSLQDFNMIAPDLEEIEIRSGTILQQAGQPVEQAIFLISGIATVLGSNSRCD